MKETISLELNKELTISVKGIYTKRIPAVYYPVDYSKPEIPAEFIIENIELEKGSLYDYTDWCNDQFIHEYNLLKKNKSKRYMNDIWIKLEELCLQKLEN